METEELLLKNAVKNARTTFYKNATGNKKKVSRKEQRKEKREIKKADVHAKRYNKEPIVEKVDEIKKKKRKKRKRKAAVKQPEDEMEAVDPSRAAYLAASRDDDRIIASLGKKLHVNKKSDVTSMFTDDGLDYILEVCEPFSTGGDRQADSSDEEYLAMKSSAPKKKKKVEEKAENEHEEKNIKDKLLFGEKDESEDSEGDFEEEDFEEEDFEEEDFEEENFEEEIFERDDEIENALNEDEDEADGASDENEDSENNEEDAEPEENDSKDVAAKYIPPSLRKKVERESEEAKIQRLKKQLKGLLNRLSGGTLPGITTDMEKLYSKNSRNTMNELVYELIFNACVLKTHLMTERLVMEHAVIVVALQTLTGSEISSYFLEYLCVEFNKLYEESEDIARKDCNNILLLLAALYNLKVVDSMLIFDLIRFLLKRFKEQDVEMILLLLKACGVDIRRDDPVSLKDIILEVQAKAATAVEHTHRVRFMLEVINALKNNNMKKIPLYDPSVVEEGRKLLKMAVKGKSESGSNSRLKVSLDDLLNAKEKGKWWVVGSAWVGRGPDNNNRKAAEETTTATTSGESEKLLEMAKKQRMNTDLRKKIFCVIMSSEDYADGFERLVKLSLKEKQGREIIHVLLDCCLQGKSFNPFFAHLADRFCQYSHSHQVTLQYSIWDRFKVLATLPKHSKINLIHLISHLLASKSISLALLKVVTFGALNKTSIRFFIRLFQTIFKSHPQNVVQSIFLRISSNEKLSLLREGLKIFLRHFLTPSATSEDSKNILELIEVCETALEGQQYQPL